MHRTENFMNSGTQQSLTTSRCWPREVPFRCCSLITLQRIAQVRNKIVIMNLNENRASTAQESYRHPIIH